MRYICISSIFIFGQKSRAVVNERFWYSREAAYMCCINRLKRGFIDSRGNFVPNKDVNYNERVTKLPC